MRFRSFPLILNTIYVELNHGPMKYVELFAFRLEWKDNTLGEAHVHKEESVWRIELSKDGWEKVLEDKSGKFKDKRRRVKGPPVGKDAEAELPGEHPTYKAYLFDLAEKADDMSKDVEEFEGGGEEEEEEDSIIAAHDEKRLEVA